LAAIFDGPVNELTHASRNCSLALAFGALSHGAAAACRPSVAANFASKATVPQRALERAARSGVLINSGELCGPAARAPLLNKMTRNIAPRFCCSPSTSTTPQGRRRDAESLDLRFRSVHGNKSVASCTAWTHAARS